MKNELKLDQQLIEQKRQNKQLKVNRIHRDLIKKKHRTQ